MSHLRTIDLARVAGVSVQQVRNYEAFGFLPPAERSRTGYRLYTLQHLDALRTARALIVGYGWKQALAAMRAVNSGDFQSALALVDAQHAERNRQRRQIEQTLAMLRNLTAELTARAVGGESGLKAGAAAGRAGVRVSALRFWEQRGLLSPARDRRNRYRMYDGTQMHRLQVIVYLRAMGHGFDAIRSVLNELEEGRPEKALEAVERRREALHQASRDCVAATAALWGYIANVR